MNYSFQERRKSQRLENNIAVKICTDDFDVVTETRNLSCTGAYCKIDKHLDPMTKLKVHFLLPLKKKDKIITKKVSCQGVVVRTDPQPAGDHYNVAIFFNDMSLRDKKSIAEYINSLLPQIR